MSKDGLVIDAGTVYTPELRLSPGRVVTDGSTITAVGAPSEIDGPANARHIDAAQYVLTPGFIEPHIHGCGGADVMEATTDALAAVSRIVCRHGTTSFLATTVSSPPEVIEETVQRIGRQGSRRFDGAQPLGIHLEGPFISAAKRGTHQVRNIARPDPELLDRWFRASQSSLRLITLAPELDGIDAVCMVAQQHGIRVAMGHSHATFSEASRAADNGIQYAVHTFNAMRDFSHREPGIVGAVLADDRIFAEIIADGIHVHPAAVRLLARAKGKSRILLVTDAISATDMPDGSYVLGTATVSLNNGVCRDAEGRLAGSTLTQELAWKNMVDWSGLSPQDALLALTQNPAAALGLSNKGRIEPGADADLVILDDAFHVMKTVVGGTVVFER